MSSVTLVYGETSRRFLLPRSSEGTQQLAQLVRQEFGLSRDAALALLAPDQALLPFDTQLLLQEFKPNSEEPMVFKLKVYPTEEEMRVQEIKKNKTQVQMGASQQFSENVVVAQYDYEAAGPQELSFKAGTCVKVTGVFNDDWLSGQIWIPGSESPGSAATGYFPSNHVAGLERIDLASLPHEQQIWQDDEYFDGYANLSIHLEMLQDSYRTLTYQRAVEHAAPFLKDKIVLDVGCGSSILSIFCAKAGAKHVYAVDASDVIKHARRVVELNGLSDKITLIKGKIEELQLPVPKVDVIISEWMGTLLICESMIASVLLARQRFLKPDGLMLPTRGSILFSPISVPEIYVKKVEYWDNVYDVNMSCLKKSAQQEFFSRPIFDQILPEAAVLSDSPVQVYLVDMQKADPKELERIDSKMEFEVSRDAVMHGFGGWFDCWFDAEPPKDDAEISNDDSIILSTSPSNQPTHWRQVIFIFEQPISVTKGQKVSGRVIIQRHQIWRRHFEVELEMEVEDKKICQSFPLWR